MASAVRGSDPDAMVGRVFSALLDGRLSRDDLTARRLSAWLGQSTMGLYHHFGSLDGFLIRVDGAGWRHLLELLEREKRRGADFDDLALAFVAFARKHPTLYWVMAERPFDRARLRAEGRLGREASLLAAFGALLGRDEDETLLVFATLHGLASLEASGRFDVGGSRRARERVEAAGRRLGGLFRRAPGRAARRRA